MEKKTRGFGFFAGVGFRGCGERSTLSLQPLGQLAHLFGFGEIAVLDPAYFAWVRSQISWKLDEAGFQSSDLGVELSDPQVDETEVLLAHRKLLGQPKGVEVLHFAVYPDGAAVQSPLLLVGHAPLPGTLVAEQILDARLSGFVQPLGHVLAHVVLAFVQIDREGSLVSFRYSLEPSEQKKLVDQSSQKAGGLLADSLSGLDQ